MEATALTGVDGCLSGSHGHVGGVGHKSGSLHHRLLSAVRKGHGELGEVHEHLRSEQGRERQRFMSMENLVSQVETCP